MNQIKVDHGQMEATKGDLKTRSDGIASHLETLGKQIDEVMQMWQGSGSEAFQMQRDSWFKSAGDLNQVLNQIVVLIGTINDNYRETDGNAAKKIGG